MGSFAETDSSFGAVYTHKDGAFMFWSEDCSDFLFKLFPLGSNSEVHGISARDCLAQISSTWLFWALPQSRRHSVLLQYQDGGFSCFGSSILIWMWDDAPILCYDVSS